jgi:hypothetical protein
MRPLKNKGNLVQKYDRRAGAINIRTKKGAQSLRAVSDTGLSSSFCHPARPRKEIALLQQSFALLAVRRKFLEFYCDLFSSCPLTPGFSKPDGAPNFGKLSIAKHALAPLDALDDRQGRKRIDAHSATLDCLGEPSSTVGEPFGPSSWRPCLARPLAVTPGA